MSILTLTSKEVFSKTVCFKAIFFFFFEAARRQMRGLCVYSVCLFLHAEFGIVFSLYIVYVHDCSLFYELTFSVLDQDF